MKIEQWSVVQGGYDSYTAPELRARHLQGIVQEHPRFTPGTLITTSSIAGLRGESVVTNSGTLYELGEVDPRYEAQFPEARDRFLKSFETSLA